MLGFHKDVQVTELLVAFVDLPLLLPAAHVDLVVDHVLVTHHLALEFGQFHLVG